MYTPNNLANGDTLTASHLNHIEGGIAENEIAAANLAEKVTTVETKLQALSQSGAE